MFAATDLAKCLFDYFKVRGYSEPQVFMRPDPPTSVCLPGAVSVTFKLPSGSSELLVLLESGLLDDGYINFMSNGKVDDFYKSISEEARDDRARYSTFLRGGSVTKKGDKYQYRCLLNTFDVEQVFHAVFNECIRPALYYARSHGGKI